MGELAKQEREELREEATREYREAQQEEPRDLTVDTEGCQVTSFYGRSEVHTLCLSQFSIRDPREHTGAVEGQLLPT